MRVIPSLITCATYLFVHQFFFLAFSLQLNYAFLFFMLCVFRVFGIFIPVLGFTRCKCCRPASYISIGSHVHHTTIAQIVTKHMTLYCVCGAV